jgi:hypothetical protein
MNTSRETISQVPLAPLHSRSWRTLWRRCSCGLPEPCVDRATSSIPVPTSLSTALTGPTEVLPVIAAPARRKAAVDCAPPIAAAIPPKHRPSIPINAGMPLPGHRAAEAMQPGTPRCPHTNLMRQPSLTRQPRPGPAARDRQSAPSSATRDRPLRPDPEVRDQPVRLHPEARDRPTAHSRPTARHAAAGDAGNEGHRAGRAGNLTPAQANRTRPAERPDRPASTW